jgi:tight adherence protein B
MVKFLTAFLLLAVACVIYYFWRRARLQNVSTRRLAEGLLAPDSGMVPRLARRPAPSFRRRYWLLPWAIGAVVVAVLWLVVGLRLMYSGTAGLVVALLGWQIEAFLAERRVRKIESQLADAIDLMVGALRAGAGLPKALEGAILESEPPLSQHLDEVAGRIQYGDAPQEAFRGLTERVPLETFLLFSSALSVHWEVGGSLAPTLATVGRTIRDRIELSRRVHAMSTQARVSISSVLGVTYFIAVMMYADDPVRMRGFLTTNLGSFLAAGAVMLQATGIVWSATISRRKI